MHAQILFPLALGVPEDGVLDRSNAFTIAALDPVSDSELVAWLMLPMRPVKLDLHLRSQRSTIGWAVHGDT
jgi:hypothetical protein